MKIFKSLLFFFLVFIKLIKSSDNTENTPTIFTNYFDNKGTLYLNGNFTDQNGGIRLFYKYYDIFKPIDSYDYYYYSNSSNSKANSTIIIPFSTNTIFKNNNNNPITIKISYGNGSEIIPIESIYSVQSYFYNIELNQEDQVFKLQGFYFSNSNNNNNNNNNNNSSSINSNSNKTESIYFKTDLNQTLNCIIKSISKTQQSSTIECKLIIDNNKFNFLDSFNFIDYNNITIKQNIKDLNIKYPINNDYINNKNKNKNSDDNNNNDNSQQKTQIPIPADFNKPSSISSYSNSFNQNDNNKMSSSKLLPIILIIPTVTLILMIFIVITIIKRIKDKKRIKEQEESRKLNNIWYNVV